MQASELDRLREGIIGLAREAAGAILEVYEGEFAVQHKDDDSPLTAADLASHRCIVAGLERLAPGIPILSEESAQEVPAQVRRQWSRMWLVDPLDGTGIDGDNAARPATMQRCAARSAAVSGESSSLCWTANSPS